MRSQGDRVSKQKHVLDIDFNKIHGTKYVDDLIALDIPKLSSPESALLLSESYDEAYIDIKPLTEEDKMSEYIFGVMKYREQEDPTDFTQYGNIVDEYLNLNIKKFYGLTISEYLDLPFSSKEMLVLKARDAMEKLSQELSDIKNKTKSQMPSGGLDDIYNGDD